MIGVSVAAEQDLDIGELEAELFDRFLDRRHISFIGAVDEDISLRCNDEKRAQRPGSNVINIANNLMGWKLRGLVFLRAHVARQNGSRSIGVSLDRDRGVIGRGLALVLGEAGIRD